MEAIVTSLATRGFGAMRFPAAGTQLTAAPIAALGRGEARL